MRRGNLVLGVVAGMGMIMLILDSKTAVSGAADGIDLCIKTVIPALFPFFIFSILITGSISNLRLPLFAPIEKLFRIPKGSASLLLIGMLGGYPAGAQSISQAYSSGQLSRNDARRMLGFCNNAGPAFIFGMIGSLFSSVVPVFILWGIHIISSLITGLLLPANHGEEMLTGRHFQTVSVSGALERSIKVMATVCGWVVIFRVILSFAERWFLWLLPSKCQLLFAGLLELSNGCHRLLSLASEGERFLFSSLFLSFGGLCVGMQTISVTGQAGLDTGFYFPGKLLQSGICMLLSLTVLPILFDNEMTVSVTFLPAALIYTAILILILRKRKNYSSIPAKAGV